MILVLLIHRIVEWWKGDGNPKPLLKWGSESTEHACEDWDWGEEDLTGEMGS